MMKLFVATIFALFLSTLSFGQNFVIRGIVVDKSTADPMAFEKIKLLRKVDSSIYAGATTDENGLFSLPKIEKGSYILKIENQAYNVLTENIEVTTASGIKNVSYKLEKRDDVKRIDEVVVSGEAKMKKNQVLISKISLDKAGIERIPSVGAENDIIGAFSVTPGVVTTGDQGGQLYVRGGTPIQNKILLDGMTIYSPFHSIGFFSVFETELIKSTDIYTGGFDAEYGGRISSIMDITYRDGNRKKFGGKISASPFMAKAVLEGPLGKKRGGEPRAGSYIFSGKQSLINRSARSLYRGVNDGAGLPFTFTDLYGKMTFNGEGGTKFSAFGFHHRDSVDYGSADLTWNASGGGLNFMLTPGSSPVFIKGHLTGSYYETSFQEIGAKQRFSSIGGFDLGFDFTYFLKNDGQFNYGINIGGFSTDFFTFNEVDRRIQLQSFTTEVGVYASYRMVKPRWVFQPSLRVQAYPSSSAVSFEPRAGLKFNATEKLRFKMSGGRYSQNFTSASSDKDVVNLFNGLLPAPDNIQETFVNQYGNERNPKNGLQFAWHAIFGTEIDLNKSFSMNIEGFYKFFDQMSNININKVYDDTGEFSKKPDEEKKDFLIESGDSYGLDFLLKYSKSRLFIWGVYSLQKSTRWDGFIEYAPVFDRRHNVNVVATYLFGKKKSLEVSMRWNFGSALPFTPTSGYFQLDNFQDGITTDYTTSNPPSVSVDLANFNTARLPTYHRLDLTIKKAFTFKNQMVIELVGSVTNLYNRRNIFYVNRVTNEVINQFPLLPSFGLSFKW